MYLGGNPAPGTTVTLPEQGNAVFLVQNLQVLWDQALPDSELFVQMFDGGGRECVWAAIRQSLPANIVITYATSTFYTGCGNRKFDTETIRATLYPIFSEARPETRSDALIARTFQVHYPFRPPPPPTPKPNRPPPGTSPTCNGIVPPATCNVGTGPPPPTAMCNDGGWSCSQTRSGTCSHHGGVACWVCPGPLC